MKKLAVAAAVAAVISVPMTASAYTNGTFDRGVLVPWATHAGNAGQSTVVGLITNNLTAGCYDADGNVRVAWVFHNVDSAHVADGQFNMTANDMEGFNWAGQNRSGTTDLDGYLVFTAQNGTVTAAETVGCLAGNAFYVDVPAADVAFVPTVPLANGDYVDGVDPRNLQANSVISLSNGTNGDQYIYARHFVDGAAGGNDTAIVLWTTGNSVGEATIFMYDDEQNDQSGQIVLPNSELNIVNPENVEELYGVDLSAAPDGFVTLDLLQITPPTGTPPVPAVVPVDAYSFSYVSSDAFGAVQTLVNPHTNVAPR